MALWMEAGSEPKTESEVADLDAITALKQSAAIELKEKGNEFVKMGKKHYSDAIDCYTRAINQKALSDSENSIIFANRAHVNLLLGNFRRALLDAEEAIKLSPTNVKAFYRASKASLSLNLLAEAKSYCEKGLEHSPTKDELMKLSRQIDSQKSECESREAQVSKAVGIAKDLLNAIEHRGLKIGKAMFQELTGHRKPMLDKDNVLHWPVLLLYAEVMSSDFIEDFCETDMFSAHLDIISLVKFCPPLAWDKENDYTREAIELYYEAGTGVRLSKKEILCSFLEGTAGSHVESFGVDMEDEADCSPNGGPAAGRGPKWVRVNEKRTLHDVLTDPKFVIPGIPVFFVVSRKSSFYKEFKAGKWFPPR
ncbi:hypothetical protein RJ639_014414 [Escallonia herrerae]|uniref:Cns1/TTC4 wheel domain-containing protein n=1 Tax=Escallonia herrerae TaxID=1293975 RepID=A0AA88VGN5_9ASTE|nr:hypothetical protein RJ639_014414 [Escallonia herrerae]